MDLVVEVFNATALAGLLTAMYALRYRVWDRPGPLVAYFSFFFALDLIGAHFFLPPGALGPELGAVCSLALIGILQAIRWVDGQERAARAAGTPP